MASEYVSFMMIFSLGISMVVAVTFTMNTLTDSTYENGADLKLNELLHSIKNQILGSLEGSQKWSGTAQYSISLDIPQIIIERYQYTISIENINNHYMLVGKIDSLNLNKEIVLELWLSPTDLNCSGSINSLDSNPILLIEKSDSGIITLSLQNTSN